MNAGKKLRTMLENSAEPLIVPEIYDCASAKAAEMNGFQVIMVSSGDLACSLTGIPDLQLLSLDEFVGVTDRITNMTEMPLIIDADEGFGRPLNTYYGCQRLVKAGAAGVLVTDAAAMGKQGQLSREEAVLRFRAARDGLGKDAILIARCDSDPEREFNEAIDRCNSYLEAGVDMICLLWMHKVKGDKFELCKRFDAAVKGWKWYPDLSGSSNGKEVTVQQLSSLNYKLIGIHYSMHAAMLSMLDVGRHVMESKTNDYVEDHFNNTGYKFFTSMSLFGLHDNSWVDIEKKYVEDPKDAIAVRNADYFVRKDDRF